MKIKFSPCAMAERLDANVAGDVLTLNGAAFDFSPLQEGARLPAKAVGSFWLASDVERLDGEICLTLLIPHGENAPKETLFPDAFTKPMTISDGPVPVPPYSVEEGDVQW